MFDFYRIFDTERQPEVIAGRFPGAKKLTLLACFSALLAGTALAGAPDPHAEIVRVAEAHVAANLARRGVVGTPRADRPDPRLRLAACDQPLETFDVGDGAPRPRVSVGVRCPGTEPWKVYVNVGVAVLENIVVAARNLPRGHVLQRSDLEVQRRDIAAHQLAYITDPAQVVGQRLTRSVLAGAILGAGVLQTEAVVSRGQRVALSAGGAGVRIRMAGIALSDGARGQRISARNLSSGKIVEGVVVDAETLRVGPGR